VDMALLKGLKEVTIVEELQTSHFRLQTSNPDAVRKQLLNLSIDHNLNIVSLQTEGHSLEEVFRALTNK